MNSSRSSALNSPFRSHAKKSLNSRQDKSEAGEHDVQEPIAKNKKKQGSGLFRFRADFPDRDTFQKLLDNDDLLLGLDMCSNSQNMPNNTIKAYLSFQTRKK